MKNKRKAIVLASSILGCIAVVSAGFAAWVIAGNTAEATAEGNIVVDTVTDKSISLGTAWKDSKNSIVFGWGDYTAQEDDWLVNEEATTAENLSVTLTLTVGNFSNLSDTGVSYTVTTTGGSYENAVTDNLVGALPNGTIAKTSFTEVGTTNTATYELTLTFTWGSAFGGENPENPLKYYNEQTYSPALASEAKTNLEKLETYLKDVTFEVTLTATANNN